MSPGEDQNIRATSSGFIPKQVTLFTRDLNADGTPTAEWASQPMSVEADNPHFEAFVFNATQSFEYYVLGDDIESPRHRITIIARPRVTALRHQLRYPHYTGRDVEQVDEAGDVRVIRGTEITIQAETDHPVDSATLLVGDERVPMAVNDGVLSAALTVDTDTHYSIELPIENGTMVAGTREYTITALTDALARVSMVWPRKDVRATQIEELVLEAEADDDVSLRRLELVVSINGGDERTIDLLDTPNPTEVLAEHFLALEEETLEPGDLIALYARATDAPGVPERLVTTDMYFIDIRPFEQRFRPRDGGGGGGGGGGQGQNEPKLSAQQRTLVVGLFKTDRDRIDGEALTERSQVLRNAQARIRERTEAIARRIGARSVFGEDQESTKKIADELPKASRAMLEAEAKLGLEDVRGALPAARTALQHLQRAEAALRDVAVARQRQNGGGQGANDLANLFQLEMDKFRNQYEEVQRASPQEQAARQLDETMRKLEEIARRQQREVNRAEQRANQGQGGAQSQAELAAQVEELIRQLERLTRQKQNEALRESLDQLREAAKAMRESGEQANPEAANDALDKIEQARRQLERSGSSALADNVNEAREQAEQLADRQRDMANELAEPRPKDARAQNANDIVERKHALADDIRKLQEELNDMAGDADGDERATARRLKDAATQLRRDQIAARMEMSAAHADRALDRRAETEEHRLTDALDAAAERLSEAAREASGEDEGSSGREAQRRLRQFMRQFEADRRAAMRERARGGTTGEQQSGDGGEPNQGERRAGTTDDSNAASGSDQNRNQSDGQQTAQNDRGEASDAQGQQNQRSQSGAQSEAQQAQNQRRPSEQSGQESSQQRGPQQGQQQGQQQGRQQGGQQGEGQQGEGQQSQQAGGEPQGGGQSGSGQTGRSDRRMADGNPNQQPSRGAVEGSGERGGWGGNDLRGFQGTLIGRLNQLNDIARRFASTNEDGKSIEAIVAALDKLVTNPSISAEALLKQHAEIGEQLKALEFQLRQAAQEDPAVVVARERAQVPDDARETIDAYFRALSEDQPPAR
ncbi:MAG: hypothetical protein AAF493_24920 [Pseudomonadota bacterium]